MESRPHEVVQCEHTASSRTWRLRRVPPVPAHAALATPPPSSAGSPTSSQPATETCRPLPSAGVGRRDDSKHLLPNIGMVTCIFLGLSTAFLLQRLASLLDLCLP